MLSVSRLPNILTSTFLVQKRFKQKIHWAKLKKKNGPTDKAMQHFDEFYGNIFGKQWDSMKSALLRRQKYVALVNNYGDAEEISLFLQNKGAHDMRRLMEVHKDFQDTYEPQDETEDVGKESNDQIIESFFHETKTSDIQNVYPKNHEAPEKLEMNDITIDTRREETLAYQTSLAKSLDTAEIDDSRLIDPKLDLSANALWQYVPATKLQGREEWIPMSQHYSYYQQGKDFPLVIEKENTITFPEHLKVYTYEIDNSSTFPEPRRCLTGVLNYYQMDGASVLPVLCLDIQRGDRILDLCSSPGGKALVMLQTLLPDIVICNDASLSRANRIRKVFKEYLCDFETSNKWQERAIITNVDGRDFLDEQPFDKVLVDVPCTTDRHSLREDDNNIFRPDRVKERLKIPEMQSELLVSALKLVKVGGSVVYSTCTLSPIQNDGVVHMALKMAFEQYGIQTVLKDLTSALRPLESIYKFGKDKVKPKYGQIVTPDVAANFGPSYFSKIIRVK